MLKGWTNGTEWWLAKDREHLKALYLEFTGLDIDEDEDAFGDDGEWREMAPDEPLSIMVDGEGQIADEYTYKDELEMKISEWARREPAGMLASKEV